MSYPLTSVDVLTLNYFVLSFIDVVCDVLFFSSRLLVMSYPAEGVESAIRHHIDDVRAFLDAHHKNAYAVYNLAGVRRSLGSFICTKRNSH